MSNKQNNGLFDCNRRDFIKVAGLGAAAMAVPGLARNAGAASMTHANQEIVETDVLVVGGGFAGVFSAIKAKAQGVDVTMAVKGVVGRSGMTPWGDAFLIFRGDDAEKNRWISAFHKHGEYLSNPDYNDLYVKNSSRIYEDLKSWGAVKSKAASFKKQVKAAGINLLERVRVKDLLLDGSRVAGAVAYPFEEDRMIIIKAKSVILATGAGGYKPNGFPLHSLTFDGDAMAYKHGVPISGKEFNATHTASAEHPANCHDVLDYIDGKTLKSPVYVGGMNITASLAAHSGDLPYVPKVPEHLKGSSNLPSYLDGSARVDGAAGHAGHKTEGIFPADSECGTDMEGLFAAGDSLASMQCGAVYNSGSVSGAGSCAQGWTAGVRAAEYAKKARKPSISDKQVAQLKKEMFAPREREKGYGPAWVTQVFQGIMIPYYVGRVKKEDRLKAALTNIEFLRDHFVPKLRAANTHELRLAHDTRNMVENAEMRLRASLFRTESRGTHFREEYPFRDDKEWLAWVLIQNVNGKMELSKKPLPEKWWPDAGLSYQERYPSMRFPGELAALKSKGL